VAGAGGGLTGLNGSNISSGTVADARLSSNVPLLNALHTDFTHDVNGAPRLLVTNPNAGAAAGAYLSASNGTSAFHYLITGTGFTGAYLSGGPSGQSAAAYTNADVPFSIGTNNAERIRIAGDGSLIDLKATDVQVNGVSVVASVSCTTACDASSLTVGDRATVAKTAGTARDTTTTATADPDLQFTSVPAGKYRLDVLLDFNNSGAGGDKVELAWPGGGSVISVVGVRACQNGSPAAGVLSSGNGGSPLSLGQCASSSSIDRWQFVADVTVASAGTISINWAQASSSGSSTTLTAASSVVLTRIN
jgi:hypothetical protein